MLDHRRRTHEQQDDQNDLESTEDEGDVAQGPHDANLASKDLSNRSDGGIYHEMAMSHPRHLRYRETPLLQLLRPESHLHCLAV